MRTCGTPRPAGIEVVERRRDLLDALADRPRDQRDLRDELDLSGSTVYKSLRELRDGGLARSDSSGRYHLTQYGRLLRRGHDAYGARLARLADARPVLDALPDDLLVPLAFVERGRIHTTETQAPERPFAAMETLSYSTERYRCLSPIAVPEYMAVIHGRVERGELEAKLLVERSALDHLGAYDRFDEMVAHGGFHLGATDERVPYGLLIADDREVAALFSYGDDGMVRGMLISDAPEAYAWADRRYTEFERDAAVIDGS